MTEILFRGKRIDNDEWVYGYYLLKDKQPYIFLIDNVEFGNKVIPETVGQYTGLKDKNKKRIFNGDIVNIKYQKNNPAGVSSEKWFDSISQVEYVETNAGFSPFYYKNGWQVKSEKIEIIGNKIDNPELLKEEK